MNSMYLLISKNLNSQQFNFKIQPVSMKGNCTKGPKMRLRKSMILSNRNPMKESGFLVIESTAFQTQPRGDPQCLQ